MLAWLESPKRWLGLLHSRTGNIEYRPTVEKFTKPS